MLTDFTFIVWHHFYTRVGRKEEKRLKISNTLMPTQQQDGEESRRGEETEVKKSDWWSEIEPKDDGVELRGTQICALGVGVSVMK